MKYYIIAGEASGDLHGSNLMRGLYEQDSRADIRYWGGPLMDGVCRDFQGKSALVQDYQSGAVMGFTQILLHLGKYLGRLRACMADIEAFHPDVVILIDYPGFNFRVAEAAHKKGYRVFYYIAPKVWASREGRIRKLKAYVDQLYIVFPFEKAYFDRKGVSYIYLGNPLVDAIDASSGLALSRAEFLSRNQLEDRKIVALLAGSRKGEVSLMMPVLSAFADRMHRLPGYADWQFVIAGAPSRSPEDYAPYLSGRETYLKVVFGQAHALLRQAEAAVVNSGTASLETCLIGTPQVVGYRLTPFNFTLAKLIMRAGFISLGNLILGRKAFKELIQHALTPENLETEVRRLVEDKEYRSVMLADYAEIRKQLGGSGASSQVAESMVQQLQA